LSRNTACRRELAYIPAEAGVFEKIALKDLPAEAFGGGSRENKTSKMKAQICVERNTNQEKER